MARHWWGGRKEEAPTGSQRSALVGVNQQYSYAGVGMPQYADWGAEGAIKQAYLTNTIVYACVQVIANTIASLPFRAGRDPLQPSKFNPDAPLARLLGPPPGGPNPDTSPSQFMANYVAQRLVTGRYGCEIEWSGTPGSSQVIALWPLVAQYLNPIPASSGNRYFSGYEYLINSVPRKLTAERCFYDWQPALHDWRQPESPLQAARLDISVAVMQDIYDKAFLQNDAKPAHMVVHQAFSEASQEAAWKEQWSATYGGPDNAGKVAFTPVEDGEPRGAIEVITLGMNQKDAEFIKRHEQKIRGICIALGVPMSKLDASGRTFDNATQEDKAFYQNTILPLVTKIQEAINTRLAPLVGSEVGWFELDGIEALQKPLRFKDASLIEAYNAGLITQNEARAGFGFDATDDGDDFAEKPAAIEPPAQLEIEATQIEPVEIGRAILPREESRLPEVHPPVQEPLPAPLRAAGEDDIGVAPTSDGAERPPAAPTIDHEVRRERLWRSTEKQLVSLESIWERRFKALFADQERQTIDRLEGKRGRQALRAITDNPDHLFDAGSIFNVEGWKQTTATESGLLYESVVATSAGRMIDRFGIDFDIEAAYVQDFILARANMLAGQVTATTYRAIQSGLIEGIQEGEGIEKLAARIRQVFSLASTTRATTIARTEVISAYNQSTFVVGMEYPDDVVAGYEWIATRDERTRDSHDTADGQQRAKGEAFSVGGFTMKYPGDTNAPASETIRCRCTLSALTPDEFERSNRSGHFRSLDEVVEELVAIAVGAAA